MPLLTVDNLKVWYPIKDSWFGKKRHVKAVDGVSFTIDEGETVGLVGESGCGKSSLGRAIARLEKLHEGTIRFNETNLATLKGRRLREARSDFQMIFQDPYGSLNPRMSIHAALDEVLRIHAKLDADGRTKRIVELLEMVHLNAEHLDRYPHQFSGGQRQRVGIARALAVAPKLVIADEPVSALDVSVQAQIINLLKEIQEKLKVAYLFIAHDLAVIEHISDQILVMYLGRIVESGDASDVCASPAHPYTKALISAVPTLDPVTRRKRIILPGDVPSPTNPPPGCPFHPRCPMARRKCRTDIPPLKPIGINGGRHSACFFAEEVGKM